jgi:hypothetical protein
LFNRYEIRVKCLFAWNYVVKLGFAWLLDAEQDPGVACFNAFFYRFERGLRRVLQGLVVGHVHGLLYGNPGRAHEGYHGADDRLVVEGFISRDKFDHAGIAAFLVGAYFPFILARPGYFQALLCLGNIGNTYKYKADDDPLLFHKRTTHVSLFSFALGLQQGFCFGEEQLKGLEYADVHAIGQDGEPPDAFA